MKKFLFLTIYCSLGIAFFSCKEIQPVTIGGVENPKLKKLSREGIEADFDMRIKNPNNMRITVFPSQFEATINDISVGKVKLTKKVRIKANSDEKETFHIKSDFSKLGFGDITKVMPIVSSGNANIYLKGNIRAGKWFYKKKFPVELKKTISLGK